MGVRMNKDAVSQAIVKLFDSEMFYAEIIVQMRRILTTNIPIAGVCIKDQIELYINPNTFSVLPLNERVAVLKHECEHILRNHIARCKEIAPDVYGQKKDIVDSLISDSKHKVLNISADCAVNSGLKDLPEKACTAQNFDLPPGETLEWYLENLKDNEKLKELNEYDDHSIWSESEGDKEIIKEKIRQAINKAADKTRAAGRMTAENELAVQGLNKSLVDWREQLKCFVAKAISVSIESSKKKRNRRYGVMYPGAVKIEDLHIGVAIDTSGSISNNSLEQFMSEIGQIAKYAKVTVVEADSTVKNSYTYDPKKKYVVKGRGGTAYQPALDFFNKMKESIDGLIYFGDMDTYDTEVIKKPKYPVLWAIVGPQSKPVDFGAEIRVLPVQK